MLKKTFIITFILICFCTTYLFTNSYICELSFTTKSKITKTQACKIAVENLKSKLIYDLFSSADGTFSQEKYNEIKKFRKAIYQIY